MNDHPSSSFWGSARDSGIVAVGILTFAGAVYTYSYVHILGIDFSLADTSPIAMLIAASRVFVANFWYALGIAATAIAIGAIVSMRPATDTFASTIRTSLASTAFQIAAVLTVAFASCWLSYQTARNEIGELRSGHANPATITFVAGAQENYPKTLRDYNQQSRLIVVMVSNDNIYVLAQQGSYAGPRSDAEVYSIRKKDILSVGTLVP